MPLIWWTRTGGATRGECRDDKLWYALGKTMAEKAAWRAVSGREENVKLATICPGLVTGPHFQIANSTATIAYLKGAHEMYIRGVLATVDVEELAKAHVGVYEAMSRDGRRASGRYLCFDRTVNTRWEAEELETRVGLANRIIIDDEDHHIIGADELWRRFELSNGKLRRLLRSPARCSYGGTLF
ncbi:hypothetical protein QJS10_CPB14g00125 [Acorus calamus]|uniref:Uncharacterized protein n=1 Tax=Acorus calamus TaxID=4465 RepID=A0AAV9DE54_ACOCL|nr:hypothetical protein QJS10_CPB14g00125 [Acorus calamus]